MDDTMFWMIAPTDTIAKKMDRNMAKPILLTLDSV
jgi:hypothetical protein